MGINYNFVMCTLTETGNTYVSSSTPREMISAVLAGMVCFISEKKLEYGEPWSFEDMGLNPPFLFGGATENNGVVTISCLEMVSSDRYLLTFEKGLDTNICTLAPAP